jgi:hypothetical protein
VRFAQPRELLFPDGQPSGGFRIAEILVLLERLVPDEAFGSREAGEGATLCAVGREPVAERLLHHHYSNCPAMRSKIKDIVVLIPYVLPRTGKRLISPA